MAIGNGAFSEALWQGQQERRGEGCGEGKEQHASPLLLHETEDEGKSDPKRERERGAKMVLGFLSGPYWAMLSIDRIRGTSRSQLAAETSRSSALP